jgi:CBS domain containing-hemolysin-like protein
MDLPRSIGLLVAIIICVIMSAYFSATETAFSTFNRIRLKTMAEDGNRKAKKILKLSDNYDTLISTFPIGNNIVNILATSLSTIFFIDLFVYLLEGKNIDGTSIGTTVSTAVLTITILVFGEISPKNIAKENADKFVFFSYPLINFCVKLFMPLNLIFKLWKKILNKIIKAEEDTGITEEELISIIDEAEEDGNFDKDESALIRSAIEFNELEVGDIFTPRIDITAVDKTQTKDEIREIFISSGYSRLPVYDQDLDNVVGLIYYKDFFSKEFGEDITPLLKPVLYVTKSKNVNDLMKELQSKKLHMAIVADEYGSTAGIVTLEDILEELVGDIWDEHDDVVIDVREIGEDEYIVSGKANLAKVFSEIGVDVEPEALTINGWAMDVLMRIPAAGDEFDADGLHARVLKMNGRRIENMKIVKLPSEDEDKDDN